MAESSRPPLEALGHGRRWSCRCAHTTVAFHSRRGKMGRAQNDIYAAGLSLYDGSFVGFCMAGYIAVALRAPPRRKVLSSVCFRMRR
mmetsp:Transcript_16626/g.29665  ORF Transcript_16626/g.29665 Transcript_16626/m.29665 type:complete len:87 (+) Transcript_16626:74-334(+)